MSTWEGDQGGRVVGWEGGWGGLPGWTELMIGRDNTLDCYRVASVEIGQRNFSNLKHGIRFKSIVIIHPTLIDHP